MLYIIPHAHKNILVYYNIQENPFPWDKIMLSFGFFVYLLCDKILFYDSNYDIATIKGLSRDSIRKDTMRLSTEMSIEDLEAICKDKNIKNKKSPDKPPKKYCNNGRFSCVDSNQQMLLEEDIFNDVDDDPVFEKEVFSDKDKQILRKIDEDNSLFSKDSSISEKEYCISCKSHVNLSMMMTPKYRFLLSTYLRERITIKHKQNCKNIFEPYKMNHQEENINNSMIELENLVIENQPDLLTTEISNSNNINLKDYDIKISQYQQKVNKEKVSHERPHRKKSFTSNKIELYCNPKCEDFIDRKISVIDYSTELPLFKSDQRKNCNWRMEIDDPNIPNCNQYKREICLTTSLCLHSFANGMELGAEDNYDGTMNIFLLILSHKWVYGLIFGHILSRYNYSLEF